MSKATTLFGLVRVAKEPAYWNGRKLHKGQFFGEDTIGYFISNGQSRKGESGCWIARCVSKNNCYRWEWHYESATNTALAICYYRRINESKQGKALFLNDADGTAYKYVKATKQMYVKVEFSLDHYWRLIELEKGHPVKQAFHLYRKLGKYSKVQYHEVPLEKQNTGFNPRLTASYSSSDNNVSWQDRSAMHYCQPYTTGGM